MAYGSLPNLGSGDVLTVAWVDQVEANAAAFLGIAQPVTSLPSSPSAGDTVRYAPAGAGSPPIWICTWDTNLNGGTGAWSVSGPPLRAIVTTAQTTTSTTYTDLATVGPSIEVLVGGIYDWTMEADASNNSASGFALMSLAGGGFTAGAGDRILLTDSSERRTTYASDRGTVTAGTVVAKYSSLVAGTARFERRRISLTPVELRP